jgi:hypothetical protein
MSRNKGTFNFAANFEPLVEAPLDARMRVSTKAELILPSIWTDANSNVWLYDGLLVSVVDDPSISNNGLYFLADKLNYDLDNSWIHIGSVSGTLDASGTSSVSFQLNNGGFGVMLTDTSGNLTVNTYDGSLASLSTGGVYINGFSGALGYEASIAGNGILTEYPINHYIGTKRHLVQMWDGVTDYSIYPQIKRGEDTDMIAFATAPSPGEWYSIIIVGF